MIEVDIPNFGSLQFEHLVLDVNGTLSLDGVLLDGVAERLGELRKQIQLHLITADTHGRQAEIDRQLSLRAVRLDSNRPDAEQKLAYIRTLGRERVVAVGNGENDSLMIEEARLGIAVLGPEGLSSHTLRNADLVVADILQGLDLLRFPKRLVATLRR
jgi:P-type E1-E2 ATPase